MKVEPQTGSIGMYWVESNSVPGQRHLVDLLSGECGCASYTCRQRAHKAKWGVPYRCKHVTAAREYCIEQFLETVRDHLLAK